MGESKSFDHLKILTKQQIIYLNQEFFFKAPTEGSVKSYLWVIRSDENQAKMDKHCADQQKSTIGKDIDDLAREFNAEKDVSKRHAIFRKRDKLLKKMKADNKYFNDLLKERDKIDKLIE